MHGNKQYLTITPTYRTLMISNLISSITFVSCFVQNILATPCNNGTYLIWIRSFFKRACSFIQQNLFSSFWSQYLFTITHTSVRKALTGEFSMAHSLATAFVGAYVMRTYN